ncbi:hypothetical protein ACFYZ2_13690 [Streptomyces sviceus]|uniref:hypothetical protein n=1 Tax=Streptomyces sviceus TaxID=285530 RepID=UPI003692CBFE
MQGLRRQTRRPDLIVVADKCTDATAEIAVAHGAQVFATQGRPRPARGARRPPRQTARRRPRLLQPRLARHVSGRLRGHHRGHAHAGQALAPTAAPAARRPGEPARLRLGTCHRPRATGLWLNSMAMLVTATTLVAAGVALFKLVPRRR